MTPEERAAGIQIALPMRLTDLHGAVANAIRAAVAEEREACAQLAEEYAPQLADVTVSLSTTRRTIAAAIRARG